MSDLKKLTIKEAWSSESFHKFRRILENACPDCEKRELCLGGCPHIKSINLCNII